MLLGFSVTDRGGRKEGLVRVVFLIFKKTKFCSRLLLFPFLIFSAMRVCGSRPIHRERKREIDREGNRKEIS